MYESFTEWSKSWKALKDHQGTADDLDAVTKQWKRRVSADVFGRVLPKPGFRKNSPETRGEQTIEKTLLSRPDQPIPIAGSQTKNLAVFCIYNNMAGAKLEKGVPGNFIADVFGVLRVGKAYHPVSIEVKVTANNCWSAVIQNLQQVRFFRAAGTAFRKQLQSDGCKIVPADRKLQGTWGVVLAPEEYWASKPGLNEAKALLKQLVDRSDARVLLVAIDAMNRLRLVGGHTAVKQN